MIYRCILPVWAKEKFPDRRKIIEGEFTDEELLEFNAQFYNIHCLPNYPKHYDPSCMVDGSHIDTFEWVYIDMDLKDKVYPDKESFISIVLNAWLPPTKIIDSGNGVHVYWRVTDLDVLSFLRLQRRLCRYFKTDEAVSKIFQLMRPPGFVNTKHENAFQMCEEVHSKNVSYTCEALDRALVPITKADEDYCQRHYASTYDNKTAIIEVDEKIPQKFHALVASSNEIKALWVGDVEDRSASDYRLGHIMHGNGFTKAEAMSVLVNAAKALERAPAHRISYAAGIVDKIWTYENTEDKETLTLSNTVREILNKHGSQLKGVRFPCWKYLDNTEHGFRLGQVVGLVAGSGVGKTAIALNMFEGFVQNNPDYDHFFIPLEQPANEIADRWKTMCGDKTHLYDKVHVISNYADDNTFRHLSFDEIKDYLLKFQKVTKRKIGCVVIDHIGALKKKGKDGENQDLMEICHQMKAFAIQTNTLLVMQSQSSREKAGEGDLELNKDAAYGTVYFESYCDYLVTVWQPLKRCYSNKTCPTVTAYKFCKIRHKKAGVDAIEEGSRYLQFFDPKNERMRDMTQDEEKSFDFFNKQATNARKQDRKTDLITYTKIRPEEETHAESSDNNHSGGA